MCICVLVARFWLPAIFFLRVVGIPAKIQISRHDNLKGILVKIQIFKKNQGFLPGNPWSGYLVIIRPSTPCQKRFLTFSHLLNNLFNTMWGIGSYGLTHDAAQKFNSLFHAMVKPSGKAMRGKKDVYMQGMGTVRFHHRFYTLRTTKPIPNLTYFLLNRRNGVAGLTRFPEG
jgi:hypothetical protein